MVKWSKRSDEDKKRILKEQQEQNKPQNEKDADIATDIYVKGRIPIMCPKCVKWRGSERYTITNKQHPFFGKCRMITSSCPVCSTTMRRAITSQAVFGVEGMVLAQTIMKLQRNGLMTEGN